MIIVSIVLFAITVISIRLNLKQQAYILDLEDEIDELNYELALADTETDDGTFFAGGSL